MIRPGYRRGYEDAYQRFALRNRRCDLCKRWATSTCSQPRTDADGNVIGELFVWARCDRHPYPPSTAHIGSPTTPPDNNPQWQG